MGLHEGRDANFDQRTRAQGELLERAAPALQVIGGETIGELSLRERLGDRSRRTYRWNRGPAIVASRERREGEELGPILDRRRGDDPGEQGPGRLAYDRTRCGLCALDELVPLLATSGEVRQPRERLRLFTPDVEDARQQLDRFIFFVQRI